MLSPPARTLQAGLSRHGANPSEAVLEALAAAWAQALEEGQPLAALHGALREGGVILSAPACAEIAWMLLGVEHPRGVRLGPNARGRLTHLVEWHDVALPSAAGALGRQFRWEKTLAPDLLRPRPWLGGLDPAPERVLDAVFRSEWSGFLALLGEFGPWVYVPSVADVQALSRRYADLVLRSAGGQEASLLAAARLSGPPTGWAAPSLLARLEATDHRGPLRDAEDLRADPAAAAGLVEAEQALWEAAEQLAGQRRARWAAGRDR